MIYIIKGYSGTNFSTQWITGAFATRQAAESYLQELQSIFPNFREGISPYLLDVLKKLDPKVSVVDNMLTYDIEAVEMLSPSSTPQETGTILMKSVLL